VSHDRFEGGRGWRESFNGEAFKDVDWIIFSLFMKTKYDDFSNLKSC